MAIWTFLKGNLDSVILVVGALAALAVLIAKKQYAIIDVIILALVTRAERMYGGKTGDIKRAAVIDWVYPKIPAVIKLFVTKKSLAEAIKRCLIEAEKLWERNPSVLAQSEPDGEEENEEDE